MSADFSAVSIQKVRDYWDSRPCNIRHSVAPIGTEEYFDQVESRKYFVEPHIPGFAEFGKWNGKRVLEIGCGIGTDTINFARAGATVTAVDLSRESLALARKRAETFGLSDRIDFCEANAEQLSEFLPPTKYDLIYSFGVIHHSPNPRKIIDQISDNFVHPRSLLKLMIYHRYAWKVGVIAIREKGRFWQLDNLIARHSEANSGCPITYTYTKSSAVKLVGDRFKITDMFIDHIFPYKIPNYTNYEYEKEFLWRYVPRKVFRALEKTIGWHLCLTAEVNGSGLDKEQGENL